MKNRLEHIVDIHRTLITLVALLWLAGAGAVKAADGSWTNDADGNWSTTANWLNAVVADGPGSTAYFTNDITAPRTVTVDTARTNANLSFADADTSSLGGWVLTGSTLTLSNSAATPLLTVTAIYSGDPTNNVRIGSVITGGQGFIKNGAGTVTLSGANTMGQCRLDEGVVTIASASALGTNNQPVTFNGGGLRFYNTGPAYGNTNSVSTTGYLISSNSTYDTVNGPWLGSGTIYVSCTSRLTFGNGNNNTFANFTGTINLSDSTSANETRFNLGSGATPYNLTNVTLNAGTNGGRFDFRPTQAPARVLIGALLGGPSSRLQSSENSGGTSLFWEIGYLNTSTTFEGTIANRNNGIDRVGHLVKVGTGKLTLTGTNVYTGNTTISNGVLALSGGGSIANAPLTNAQTITVVSPGVFDVSGLTASFSLPAGRTLAGNGAVTGNFVATNGLITPGLSVGTLTFSNNLTVGGTGATNLFEVTSPGVNDKILIGGDLILNDVLVVRTVPTGATIPAGTYTLYKWTGNLSGDTNFLTLEFPPQTGTLGIEVNLGAKEIRLVVTGVSGAANLTWRGDGANNNWDTTTQNWRNSGNPSVFTSGDNATFDNSGSNTPPINLTGAMNPGSVVVNATKDYTFSTTTSGYLTGSGSLVKTNTGRLIVTTDNDTTGPITNYAGILQVGNDGSSGALGTSPVTLSNNASLLFQRSDTLTAGNVISGGGVVVQNGGGTVALAGANSHTGGTIVSNGTLNITSPGGLGAGTLVLAGGTVSAGSVSIANALNVTANSTINNTGGEIQFTSDSISGSSGATLSLAGTQMRFAGSGFALSSPIDLQGSFILRAYNPTGTQTFNGVISGSGVYQRRWPDSTASNDGTTIFNAANTYSGNTLLREGSIGFGISSVSSSPPTIDSGPIGTGNLNQDNATYTAVFASGAARTVGNPIVLNSGGQAFIVKGAFDLTLSGTVDLGGASKTIQVDNSARTILSGDISNGELVKSGSGTLYLNGNDNASSNTVASGSLGGTGTISGPVTVQSGAALAPGASVGTLTINNDLMLSGNLLIEVNRSLTPSNDIVTVSGVLTNAGTGSVTVNNLGPALAVGNKFTLFNKPLTNGNALAVTGAGATWANNLAVDGSITVASLGPTPKPVITATFVSGTNLVFSGTNGTGTAGGNYYVLSSTNVTTPLINWTHEATNTFGVGGVFSVTNPITAGTPRKYFGVQLQ